VIRKEHRLARLLSGRPGLSRPEKEEILDAVLARTAAAPAAEPRQHHGLAGVLLAVFAGAAGVLLVASPSSTPPMTDEFTARGAPTGPSLTAVCAATSVAGTCASGGELLFELADAGAWSHVALFAFREDGTAIWYAPQHDDGESLAFEREPAMTLLPRRVRLDDEHPAGRYTVAAVLSRRPLHRPEIREIYEHPEAHSDARVLETEVQIR
jgi:hypothetical protein